MLNPLEEPGNWNEAGQREFLKLLCAPTIKARRCFGFALLNCPEQLNGGDRWEIDGIDLVFDVRPHHIEHLEGMVVKNIRAIHIIPFIIQVCEGLVWLVEDVSIIILNQIGRLILQLVF